MAKKRNSCISVTQCKLRRPTATCHPPIQPAQTYFGQIKGTLLPGVALNVALDINHEVMCFFMNILYWNFENLNKTGY